MIEVFTMKNSYRQSRLNVIIGQGSIEGWLVFEEQVGTADFAKRQSG